MRLAKELGEAYQRALAKQGVDEMTDDEQFAVAVMAHVPIRLKDGELRHIPFKTRKIDNTTCVSWCGGLNENGSHDTGSILNFGNRTTAKQGREVDELVQEHQP